VTKRRTGAKVRGHGLAEPVLNGVGTKVEHARKTAAARASGQRREIEPQADLEHEDAAYDGALEGSGPSLRRENGPPGSCLSPLSTRSSFRVVSFEEHDFKLVARAGVVSASASSDDHDAHDLKLLRQKVLELKERYPSWYCREQRCPYRLGWEHSSGYCPRHEGRKGHGGRSPQPPGAAWRSAQRRRARLEQQKTSFWFGLAPVQPADRGDARVGE
jgi:hypothetical protein